MTNIKRESICRHIKQIIVVCRSCVHRESRLCMDLLITVSIKTLCQKMLFAIDFNQSRRHHLYSRIIRHIEISHLHQRSWESSVLIIIKLQDILIVGVRQFCLSRAYFSRFPINSNHGLCLLSSCGSQEAPAADGKKCRV